MSTEATITGLARRLVSDRLLEREAAIAACSSADQDSTPLIRHLVKNRLVDSLAIARAASQEFGLPLLDLSVFDPANFPGNVIDAKLMRKYNVLPLLRKGNRLYVGVSDPSDLNLVSEIKFHTGLSIDLIVLEDDKLNLAIENLLHQGEKEESNFSDLEGMGLEDIDIEVVEDKLDSDDDDGDMQDETPIVRFVNKVLYDAIKQGASDIHIEPYEKIYRVRFRQDGILREIARPPLNIANRICSRVKIMSSMDISERRIPQDGRIKLKLSRTKSVDFRVNTLPTLWGEKIVLRILDPSSAQLGIDVLGYEPLQKQQYLNALHQHQGLILVTGPTGSGKTVSLYTGLNILNTKERNISTAEDPVEINLEGVNQVAVNAKVGLTFATALRAFLRQDPDVVMVGEIRDGETADVAVKAALTGHLVLSTLHTNDAAGVFPRLIDMGVEPFLVQSSVALAAAQRLLKRVCDECKEPIGPIPPDVLERIQFRGFDYIPEPRFVHGRGCSKCRDKGYKGRTAIIEVMLNWPEIQPLVLKRASGQQIKEAAIKCGMQTLRQAGLAKAARGITTIEQVLEHTIAD